MRGCFKVYHSKMAGVVRTLRGGKLICHTSITDSTELGGIVLARTKHRDRRGLKRVFGQVSTRLRRKVARRRLRTFLEIARGIRLGLEGVEKRGS